VHSLNRPEDAPCVAASRAGEAAGERGVSRPSAPSAAWGGLPDLLADPLRDWLIPRLAERQRESLTPPALGARWLASLSVDEDPNAVCLAIQQLQRQGIGPEAIQFDWLAGAAHELGRRWDEDECTFADVTVGMVRLQCAMRHLYQPMPSGQTGGSGQATPRILLLLAPGEQHGFGLTLVAEAFRRAAWDVTCLQDARALSPTDCVAQTAFDVVGLSVGSTPRMKGLRELCEALRRKSCRPGMGVMLGGPFFATQTHPVHPQDWGVDAVLADGRQAVAAATRLRAQALAVDPAQPTLEAVRW
jgi:methanogenic corrinoid protein MtbC1